MILEEQFKVNVKQLEKMTLDFDRIWMMMLGVGKVFQYFNISIFNISIFSFQYFLNWLRPILEYKKLAPNFNFGKIVFIFAEKCMSHPLNYKMKGRESKRGECIWESV